MRFDLKKPCKACPFRLDRPGYLDGGRAEEIAANLLADDFAWFGCHETTEVNEDGDLKCVDETQQCHGALRFQFATVGLNVPSRIAALDGLLDLDSLDRSIPVAESKEQFVKHHSKSTGTEKVSKTVRGRKESERGRGPTRGKH